MKSIIVTKYGSVFRTRANLTGASQTGEQGETEGVIRHLLERYSSTHQVVYFGQYRGNPLPGLVVVESDLSRVRESGEWSSEDEQKAGFESDRQTIMDACGDGGDGGDGGEIVGMICVDGYAPTFSHVYNPNGATVQCAAINYCAPQLALLESLKIPRICINNDPRCVPRDQEMSYGWEYTRPVACLGQWDHEFSSKIIGRQRYRCKTVHARAESWAYLEQDWSSPHSARTEVNVIAHAHLEDGMRCGSRDAWQRVLSDAPEGTRVYGRGWEAFAQPNQESYDEGRVKFVGPCRPSEVAGLLDTTLCCPVVSHTPGFYTGKPWVLMSRGVVPLLFGADHSHTYDPKGILIACDPGVEDRMWRVYNPGDFKDSVERLLAYPKLYENTRERWQKILEPDFRLLDEICDRLFDNTFVQDERYGGYWRL